MGKKRKDGYSSLREAGLLSTIPFLLAGGPVIGFFVGSFLDKRLGTSPYLSIVFVVLGFVAGIREVYKVISLAMREERKREEERK
ncbi:MAG: AtpZ/AtpI family protein [Candidatus Eisenbacteria bacterium]|nr:AtpZ/AtpI family protein [Candidatus Eisenbacteria bacterium]